jgi:preprotein translocase subunit SecE
VGSSPAWPVDTTPPFFFGNLSGGVVTVSKKESNVAGKDDKSKRENAIQRFFRETIGELRRVHWPTWPEARRLTIIVIIVLVIMSFFLFMVDEIAVKLLSLAIGA